MELSRAIAFFILFDDDIEMLGFKHHYNCCFYSMFSVVVHTPQCYAHETVSCAVGQKYKLHMQKNKEKTLKRQIITGWHL